MTREDNIPGNVRAAVSSLLKKNNLNPRKAFDNLNKEANKKMNEGRVPNNNYPLAIGLLQQITPIEDSLKKIKYARNKTGSKVLDNLIYDHVTQLNSILESNTYEQVDPVNVSPEQEALQYRNAIIKIESEIPNIKNNEDREKLVFTLQAIGQVMSELNAR